MKSLHLDKVGFVGDFVTILCCLGFGPLLSVLSAIGAGFLIDDAVLAPLLVVFLALGAIGHYASHREHRRWTPLALHALSAAGVLVFTFVVFVQPMVWAGVAGLLSASVWNVVLRRRCRVAGDELVGTYRTRKPTGLTAIVAWLLLVGAPRAQIVTENAGVISPETPIVREALSVLDAEHLREVRWDHQLIFALDPARELKLIVPLVWRDLEFATAGSVEDADLAGLGDVSLRFKQSLWQADAVMASTRWAALAEVGAPTGEDDATENGALIPRRLQLGTGDWSLGAGTAYTWIRDRQRFSAETFFRYRTRHEGLRLGETLDLNLAWWYRIAPARFPPGEPPLEVRGVLELLSSYRWPSEGDGDLHDDGTLVWLAPGLQVYPSKTVLLEVALRAPIHQDLDDALGDRRWAGVLALKFLF